MCNNLERSRTLLAATLAHVRQANQRAAMPVPSQSAETIRALYAAIGELQAQITRGVLSPAGVGATQRLIRRYEERIGHLSARHEVAA